METVLREGCEFWGVGWWGGEGRGKRGETYLYPPRNSHTRPETQSPVPRGVFLLLFPGLVLGVVIVIHWQRMIPCRRLWWGGGILRWTCWAITIVSIESGESGKGSSGMKWG